jgi:hypothetical protein
MGDKNGHALFYSIISNLPHFHQDILNSGIFIIHTQAISISDDGFRAGFPGYPVRIS